MIWGIPAFRLPPGIIQEDIDRMTRRCPGMEVHLDTALGRDVTLDELKQRHDAVILAIGAWWGKKMGIPGEDRASVIDGVQFLRDVNEGARPEMPETVVVVGGGDVAMDACRVAKRLPGCNHVKVIYRRGPAEIPARRDRAGGRDRGGDRVRLPHPADGDRGGRQRARAALRDDDAGGPGRIGQAGAGERAGHGARYRLRHGDRRSGPGGALRRPRPARPDGGGPGAHGMGGHGHERPLCVRRRRRGLRRLHHRDGDEPRPAGRLLRQGIPRRARRAAALPHALPHAAGSGGAGPGVGAAAGAASRLPRAWRRPGGVPGDRDHLWLGGGAQGGGALLPLRRRDRLRRLRGGPPGGHLRDGPHRPRRHGAAAGDAGEAPGRARRPLPGGTSGHSRRSRLPAGPTCRAW